MKKSEYELLQIELDKISQEVNSLSREERALRITNLKHNFKEQKIMLSELDKEILKQFMENKISFVELVTHFNDRIK